MKSHDSERRSWSPVPGSRVFCEVCEHMGTCLNLHREKKLGLPAGVGWLGQEARDKWEVMGCPSVGDH